MSRLDTVNTRRKSEAQHEARMRETENSEHPKIPAGELLVVLFDNCEFKGEKCKALGLFKSESKDKFFDL